MILAIWEGTGHRQMLDALAVMERFAVHRRLLDYLLKPAQVENIQAILRQAPQGLGGGTNRCCR